MTTSPTIRHRLRMLVAAVLALPVLMTAPGVACAEIDPAGGLDRETDRIVASGSIGWLSDDTIDLLGELGVRFPFRVGERSWFYIGLDTQTVIEQSIDDFTFVLQELDYTGDLGVRRRSAAGRTWSFFAGQQGQARVDLDGHRWVRHLGVALESVDYERAPRRFKVAAGPVLDEHGVSADAFLRADGRMDFLTSESRPDFVVGFGGEVDGLLTDGELEADLRVGPHVAWYLERGYRVTLFAQYARARNPLGPRFDGVLAGFRLDQARRRHCAGEFTVDAPDVNGLLSAGGGDGRRAGRLLLDFRLPLWGPGWIVLDFDVNVLTADDTRELYYLYDVGYEWKSDPGVWGIYFFHRSNHAVSEPNPVGITSVNVLEAGLQSRDWRRPGPPASRRRWGAAVWQARLGVLLSSTFGESRRWHVEGNARWWLPWGRTFVPVIEAGVEDGDVGRRHYAAGISGPANLLYLLEYRKDDQYFGRDKTALLLTARITF